MKSKRKISVRAKLGEEWRSITIDLFEEENEDGVSIGQLFTNLMKEIIKIKENINETKLEDYTWKNETNKLIEKLTKEIIEE